jgi:Domain of unknown function (DUF1707)
VATEPPDFHAGWAARHGHLRASDAERELVIDGLKTAFVRGRLTSSELARRAGQALEARTYADLAGATAGIPAAAPASRPAPASAHLSRARPINRKLVAWVLVSVIVLPGLGVAFFDTYYGSFFILLFLGFIVSSLIGSPEPPVASRHRAR